MKKILVLNFSVGLIVLLTGLFVASTSYADRIVHETSGKCWHPKGRDAVIKDYAGLVLHSDNCDTPDSRLEFVFKDSKIVHEASGKCVNIGLDILLKPVLNLVSDCYSVNSTFELTSKKQIKYKLLGYCVHPKGGAKIPGNNTKLVLHRKCGLERTQFSFNSSPSDYAITTKLYHSYSGLCVHPKGRKNDQVNNTELVLHGDDCDSIDSRLTFTMNDNGSIKHTDSGKCFQPKGNHSDPGNNTKLVLHDGCSQSSVLFEQLSNGAIRHKSSGKCIHPKGGKPVPKHNTNLVLWDDCKAGYRIKWNFFDVKLY